jgi:hypothetical protein
MTTLKVEPSGPGTPDKIEQRIIRIATEVAEKARTEPQTFKSN